MRRVVYLYLSIFPSLSLSLVWVSISTTASPLPAAAAGWLCHNYMATYLTIKRCYQFSHKIITFFRPVPTRCVALCRDNLETCSVFYQLTGTGQNSMKMKNWKWKMNAWENRVKSNRQMDRQTDNALWAAKSHKYFLTILWFPSFCVILPEVFL